MSFSRPHSGLLLPCAYSRSSQVTHLLGLLHRRFTIWKKTTPFSRSLTVSPRPPTSLPYLRVPMLGRALSCLFPMFSIYMASLRTLFLTIGPILPLPRVVGILHGCRTLRQSLFRRLSANQRQSGRAYQETSDAHQCSINNNRSPISANPSTWSSFPKWNTHITPSPRHLPVVPLPGLQAHYSTSLFPLSRPSCASVDLHGDTPVLPCSMPLHGPSSRLTILLHRTARHTRSQGLALLKEIPLKSVLPSI